MAQAGGFIILSNQDVRDWNGKYIESDCATDTSLPSVMSQLTQKIIESDCACPTDGMVLQATEVQLQAQKLRVVPELHIEELNATYQMVFNPLKESGVIVLNQDAFALLMRFQDSSEVDSVIANSNNTESVRQAILKLFQYGLLSAENEALSPKSSHTQTLTAWIHVTNNCNLRCVYCYVNKTNEVMESVQGKQAIEAVFRSAVKNGFQRVKLKYAGGEVSMNWRLAMELHDYAFTLAERYNIALDGVLLSNAVSLPNSMIQAIKQRNLHLMISLDGVGPQNDVQRPLKNGQGSFAYVEQTLDRLSTQGIVPTISVTISKQNLSSLPETVDYVLLRGLPFTLNFYRENQYTNSEQDLAFEEDEIIAAMKAAFSRIERKLPIQSLLGSLTDRARLDAMHDRPCGVGDSYMVINHRGGVSKCQMELESSITDISVEDPLSVLRRDNHGLQNLSVQAKEGCRSCTWRYWCAGGCPALTYRMTGRYDIKSPNCRIYKSLFPDVLKLEALRIQKYANAPMM